MLEDLGSKDIRGTSSSSVAEHVRLQPSVLQWWSEGRDELLSDAF